MRGRFLVAILGAAGICVLAAALVVWLVSGTQPETSSTVIAIPDNPAALAAVEVQDTEVVAPLPNAAEEPPAEEATAPAVPEKLSIIDTVRLKLKEPGLREGVNPDDLAALEAFYAQYDGPARWLTSAGLTPEARAIIGELANANDWGLDADAFTVPPADYRPVAAEDQAVVEIVLDLAILKYARAARGGRADPSAVHEAFDQKPPVREPGTVLTEIAATDAPDAYLRNLHPKHAQFEALRQALLKARAEGAANEDVHKLLVNMERWRWMPEDLGTTYVLVNIPEFMVHVVKDGKTIESEKIVVGSPSSPTPVFTADLKSIVFNPERVVPLSIIRKEVLPKLKGRSWLGGSDTSVLEQYQLTVKHRGKPIDPSQIDWDKVNLSALTFVQAPGRTNVLGKVQFLYPNDHGVFMSDTIIRGQFARDVRAEGDQDPRVANPDEVAATLLAEDKDWSKAKVNQLVAGGKTTEIKIDKSIPVHTTYFTALVDDEGKVKTFDDVYKLDGAVEAVILGKATPAPAVSEPAPAPSRKPVNGSLAASAP